MPTTKKTFFQALKERMDPDRPQPAADAVSPVRYAVVVCSGCDTLVRPGAIRMSDGHWRADKCHFCGEMPKGGWCLVDSEEMP